MRVRGAVLVTVVALLAGGCAVPWDSGAAGEARHLLSLAQVPPGAVPVRTPPPGLDASPMGRPQVDGFVDAVAYWRVSMPFDQTLTWVRAHPPGGLAESGRASSNQVPTVVGLAYRAPDGATFADGQLQVGLADGGGATSYLRFDGTAVVLDPTPLTDGADGPRLRVTVAAGCPASNASMVGVTNTGSDLRSRLLPDAAPTGGVVCVYGGDRRPLTPGAQTGLTASRLLGPLSAAAVARAMTAVRLAHTDGTVSACGLSLGAATVVAFTYLGRPDVDVWDALGGCGGIANGMITAPPQLSLQTTAPAEVAAALTPPTVVAPAAP